MTETTTAEAVDVGAELETFRRELTGYCYRMLGSAFDADDAVQETLVRAWRGIGGFEGRSSLRSWVYRIATNVCMDLRGDKHRRVLPVDLAAPSGGDAALPAPLPETTWLQPIADHRVLPVDGDPGDVAATRETIRLAFVAALQHLPPSQRAILILRDVLRWRTSEVAALLDTTPFAVKSALQRARATMVARQPAPTPLVELDEAHAALLTRYVDAFERYDIEQLIALLHDDARLSMPPHALWLRGKDDIRTWLTSETTTCRGSTMVRISANGVPSFAQYKPSRPGAHPEAFAILVPEISDGRIGAIDCFVDRALFEQFGLPIRFQG